MLSETQLNACESGSEDTGFGRRQTWAGGLVLWKSLCARALQSVPSYLPVFVCDLHTAGLPPVSRQPLAASVAPLWPGQGPLTSSVDVHNPVTLVWGTGVGSAPSNSRSEAPRWELQTNPARVFTREKTGNFKSGSPQPAPREPAHHRL
jgi:hypothetical protein